MIGKTAVIKGKPRRIELTEEEYDELMEELIKTNKKELERVCNNVADLPVEFNKAVKLLFDKQATASFSVINSALDKKIQGLKEEDRKELSEKDKEFVSEIADEDKKKSVFSKLTKR